MTTMRRVVNICLLGAIMPFVLTACGGGGGGGGGGPLAFTVTPSVGANGSISPSTSRTVNQGATTSFTITADSGYGIGAVIAADATSHELEVFLPGRINATSIDGDQTSSSASDSGAVYLY